MGDWASDLDSAYNLDKEAARKLYLLNPNHELLKYAFLSEKEAERGVDKNGKRKS